MDVLPQPTQVSADTVPASFFSAYAPAGVSDELRGVDGRIHAHWQRFTDHVNSLGHDELARRWDHAQRLIYENGVAYSVHGDRAARLRPWELDALPLILPASEWTAVAEGLKQRALLWDLMLADLYGPQRLIREGVVPPEILYRHPGFLRPLHRPQQAYTRQLQFYAADLARGPQGSWWVMADRTEAPSGAGFALENRIVISRMFPHVFRDCCVERLAPYFVAVRESLQRLAPRHRDNPRIVWLSQGPQSVNVFEDAYLARYLGYTLVEAGDLLVRGSEVMLKTLGGLLPVDVVVRRINSAMCDPLELQAAGATGVPGLVQSTRDGNVAIVNSLGSGTAESPVFMAMTDKLAQALLGEDLRLPDLATWWCGDPTSLSHVLAHLDDLIVKPAFRERGTDHLSIRRLNETPRSALIELIQADPQRYVAQERSHRSTAPCWRGNGFTPRYIALRSYLVASDDSYVVLPGGLTRTSPLEQTLESSVVLGEGSKDTWVLSDHPVEPVSLLSGSSDGLKLRRSASDLPSRVADNLFWLGRQLERVEAAARLLRTVVVRLTSETGSASLAELPSLLRVLAAQGQIEAGFVVEGIRDRLPTIEQALPKLVFDASGQPGCLRALLDDATRIGSLVRDRISSDSWRILLHMDRGFRASAHPDLTDLLNLTNQLLIDLAAFSGMVMESMTRAQAFRFLDLGRRVEKSLQIIQLVLGCFGEKQAAPNELLEAILEIGDSLMTYRARYLAQLRLSAVLDLLLTDETNPRSLAFQLVAICAHVDSLPRDAQQPGYAPEQRIAMTMLHNVRQVDIEQICESHHLGDPSELIDFLLPLSEQLPKLSNAVSHRYLVHAGPSQQLGQMTKHVGQD